MNLFDTKKINWKPFLCLLLFFPPCWSPHASEKNAAQMARY